MSIYDLIANPSDPKIGARTMGAFQRSRDRRDERKSKKAEMAQISDDQEKASADEETERVQTLVTKSADWLQSLSPADQAKNWPHVYRDLDENGADMSKFTSTWDDAAKAGVMKHASKQVPFEAPEVKEPASKTDVNGILRYTSGPDKGKQVFTGVAKTPEAAKDNTMAEKELAWKKEKFGKEQVLSREKLAATAATAKAAVVKAKKEPILSASQKSEMELETQHIAKVMVKIKKIRDFEKKPYGITSKSLGTFHRLWAEIVEQGTGYTMGIKIHDQLIDSVVADMAPLIMNNPRLTAMVKESAEIAIAKPGFWSGEDKTAEVLDQIYKDLALRVDTLNSTLAKQPGNQAEGAGADAAIDYMDLVNKSLKTGKYK